MCRPINQTILETSISMAWLNLYVIIYHVGKIKNIVENSVNDKFVHKLQIIKTPVLDYSGLSGYFCPTFCTKQSLSKCRVTSGPADCYTTSTASNWNKFAFLQEVFGAWWARKPSPDKIQTVSSLQTVSNGLQTVYRQYKDSLSSTDSKQTVSKHYTDSLHTV